MIIVVILIIIASAHRALVLVPDRAPGCRDQAVAAGDEAAVHEVEVELREGREVLVELLFDCCYV